MVPGRWQQRAGFSVFFDTQPAGPAGPGAVDRRTRLYHEETGDETAFGGWEPAGWVRWMLERLTSAQPASGPAGAAASLPSTQIVDVRLTGDAIIGAGDEAMTVELDLHVTGTAELRRRTGSDRRRGWSARQA